MPSTPPGKTYGFPIIRGRPAWGGACERGIYDNMKTAVDAVFVGKDRKFNRRNRHVRHLPGHCPHQLDDTGVRAPAVLSGTVPAHPQSGVIFARPADNEIEAVIHHPHDDLLDQHADDTFACGYGRSFRMPGALDIGAEPE